MEYVGYLLLLVVVYTSGWLSAIYRIAKNPNFREIKSDEMICKKTPEGLMLVAVTPDIARRLVYSKDAEGYEARSLALKQ